MSLKRCRTTVVAVALLALPAPLLAQASSVVSGAFSNPYPVASYTMYNGYSGTWRYLDYTYNGSGDPTADKSWLSGGTGLLTDGFGAVASWDATPNPRGTYQGQFVGWGGGFSPTITFYFSSLVNFNSIRVNFDISNAGRVAAPGPTIIDGTTFATTIPSGTLPFWAEFDVSGTPATSAVTLTFTNELEWVMVSEVQFDGTAVSAVPEPASVALVGTGLLGVVALARRRQGHRRIAS